MITLYVTQQKIHRCIEQSFGLCGRGRGWDMAKGEWPTESVPLRTTQVPEPERLRTGRCMQPRAGLRWFPAEQPRSWVVWAGRVHVPWARAGPVWLTNCKHTPVLLVCSIPPSPQCDWTSERRPPPKKKVTTSTSLVSGWKSDTEETSKQKKLKQRESPWTWQVQ